MQCPFCQSWSEVSETRGTRRRRRCANGHRFSTQEVQVIDFGRCAVNNNEPIPAEFIGQREQCDAWEHDEIPF